MSLTVNTNTYISLDDADEFLNLRYYSDNWDALSDSDKEAYLKAAAHILDNYVVWHGVKTDSSQAMQWPRRGARDLYGKLIADDEIPQVIKNTQCELALALIDHDLLNADAINVQEMDVAGINVNMGQSEIIPHKIFVLIEHLGQRLGNRSSVRLTR